MFRVETIEGTIEQIIVWISCIAFVILFSFVKNKELVILGITWTVIVSSYVVLTNVISFPHFLLSVSQEVSGLGERLNGFFQYANAFASILGMFVLFHLGYATRENRPTISLPHQGAVLPLWTLFLLTESRGAWGIFFIAWLASFLIVPKKQYIKYTFLSIYSFIGGTIVYKLTIANGHIHFSFLAATVLVVSLLLLWFYEKKEINNKLQKINNAHLLPIYLCIMAMLFVADICFKGLVYHMLPITIQRRLSFNLDTLTDRILYWKDAWSEWESFIWTGLGGKAWKFIMYRAQSFPYLSSELHNGYLNLLVEIGMVGTLYILFLIALAGTKLWQQRATEFAPFTFLIAHAIIEFTFSFPVIIMAVLMLVSSGIQEKYSSKYLSLKGSLTSFMFIICGIVCFQFIKAEQTFASAQYAHTKEKAYMLTKQAMEQNKWNTTYVLFAIENELLSLKDEKQAIERALKNEPNHALLLFYAGKHAEKMKNMNLAATYYEKSLANDRFDRNKYVLLTNFYLHMEEKAKENGHLHEAKQWKEKAKELHVQMEHLLERIKEEKRKDERSFHFYK
ncbi:O-antigen ligase family protein [Anoxybacillus sp. D401a]|uniref:O-antigen ligase family protein n=1 Tax=Anoxybacillus sp. D401a TaxID=575112 RepID=UPI003D33A001